MHWPVLGFLVYAFIRYWFSPYEYESRLETLSTLYVTATDSAGVC